MINSGRWLGKANADGILSDLLLLDINEEQVRAVITAYCLLFSIKPNTDEWDTLINDVFKFYNRWFDSKKELNIYMEKLLV